MSPPRSDFQLGLWISGNSDGNVNTAKLMILKNRMEFISWRKTSSTLDQGSYLGYTPIIKSYNQFSVHHIFKIWISTFAIQQEE